ncbi:unnamed protein product, partial [Didymodactylos carnosus]
MPDETLGSCM